MMRQKNNEQMVAEEHKSYFNAVKEKKTIQEKEVKDIFSQYTALEEIAKILDNASKQNKLISIIGGYLDSNNRINIAFLVGKVKQEDPCVYEHDGKVYLEVIFDNEVGYPTEVRYSVTPDNKEGKFTYGEQIDRCFITANTTVIPLDIYLPKIDLPKHSLEK